uniref:Vipericidin n=1 Tax=Pseudonaja textilis TaxID=8673 RepID=A0A670ZL26_PSETE
PPGLLKSLCREGPSLWGSLLRLQGGLAEKERPTHPVLLAWRSPNKSSSEAFKLAIRFCRVSFQDPYSESNQELNFTIKETVCPAEEEFSMEECDFKENGVRDRYPAGGVINPTLEPFRETEGRPIPPPWGSERCSPWDQFLILTTLFSPPQLVRQCTGYFFLEERPPVAVLTCDTVVGTAKEEEKEEEEEEEEKVRRRCGGSQDGLKT